MKWAYSVKQKIRMAILLAMVIVLVFVNNIYQNRRFEKVVNDFTSLYEDRLVAETYIYKIASSMQQLRHIVENPDLNSQPKGNIREMIMSCDRDINTLIQQYLGTKFTENEKKQFSHLHNGINQLSRIEKTYFVSTEDSKMQKELNDSIQTLVENNLYYLSELSKIQIEEGKRMTMESNKALMSHISSSQLETSILIIIAIIIQVLIFASRSVYSRVKQRPGLN